MEIRLATIEDATEIRKIYAPYVENTAVSFEYEVPSVEEFEKRIQKTLKEYPYLVATEAGQIVGYAYASAFHAREAYKHCAELSIYINQGKRRMGIGKSLYARLEELLVRQNVYSVHACIASPDGVDSYLTDDSERFHRKMGFETAGRHTRCGYKFGRWYSIVWMDKVLREKDMQPKPFIAFNEM